MLTKPCSTGSNIERGTRDGGLGSRYATGRSRAEARLRRHCLPRWDTQPVPEGNDHRLGRRPPALCRYPLPADAAEPERKACRRDQCRRSDVRKGCRFKGQASLHSDDVYERGLALLAERGYDARPERVRTIVLVKIEQAAPLVSPAYDSGATEEAVAARWERHLKALLQRRG